MAIYIALLRGINVGGKNKIRMSDLREALGTLGLARVQTYIQSGNILFESNEDEATLRQRIEQMIDEVFGLSINIIIRTSVELKKIVENCPYTDEQIVKAEASSEGESLYVALLMEEPKAESLDKLKSFDVNYDQYRIDGRDIFLLFHQSIRNSKLANQIEKLGVPVTVRNWNTINKLLVLSSEMNGTKCDKIERAGL
jgi:uncharacterized protein (DUF1697 family)